MHLIRSILTLLIFFASTTGWGQEIKRIQPVWWFGGALGGNINVYSSDFKNLNSSISVPSAFTKGSGLGIFVSPLVEYKPDPVWGGQLFLGFDGRGGSFSDTRGNDTSNSLSSSMNYITLEPSICCTPFEYPLYFFAGPRIGFNVAKSFTLNQTPGGEKKGDFDNVRGTAIGAQIGAGYEFSLTKFDADWQVIASPFLSVHFGQGPRSEESWGITTVRAGLAIKFGNSLDIKTKVEKEVQFTIRAPRIIPRERKVEETFPLRNYVFFDKNSEEIPSRYVRLTYESAQMFKEEQLLEPQPKDLTGRSRRQLTVYHNILNILGDRLRKYTRSSVTLIGSSEYGESAGKELAESVKRYLMVVFGIDGERITTRGSAKPAIPSVQPGATRELDLVIPEDRRVEITSSSSELLEPVKIISLQEDPMDSDVLFSVSSSDDYFASWSLILTDETGKVKHLGPYASRQERIPGKLILGDKMKQTYKVVFEGSTSDGNIIRKEDTMRLIMSDEPEEAPGFRFSILFEFDQSKTVATYKRFLTQTVAPMIADGSSIIIHGHTDIIGEESHNLALSRARANETMAVIDKALQKLGKRNISYDTYGFGEDIRRAPFDNNLPEERFYNRTVIIDIVPE